MIGAGRMPFNGMDRNRGYSPDDDWEVSEELSPDPFSEEEHTKIHGRRFAERQRSISRKPHENQQNQEISGDIGR